VTMTHSSDGRPRARGLGITLPGEPGPLNAITDVGGVEVGVTTLIGGTSVRTGVTAILPRGREGIGRPCAAGWYSLNGNGEMTGTTWIDEAGSFNLPVVLSNTHAVGACHTGVVSWVNRNNPRLARQWLLPVCAETWDGYLNDINGFHVQPPHVFHAIDSASSGPVEEGAVGGGTGMVCNGFKGGIGTASRVVSTAGSAFTVGVLVQCNYGRRYNLRIAGIPVGREMEGEDPYAFLPSALEEHGSIIVVVATDAPLLPHQLKRLARRVSLGIGRTGSIAGNGSGDIFLAFSTANPGASAVVKHPVPLQMVPNDDLDPIFLATVEATEESVVNAMIAATDMTGVDGHVVHALPHDKLRAVLARYNRLRQ